MTSARRRAVGGGREHETLTPDVDTASASYAARFTGAAGAWMLDVQGSTVDEMMRSAAGERLSVLEVGAGHGQLTARLLAAGHAVTVHGSRLVCHRGGDAARRVVSSLWQLPFADRSFDLVVAIRLLPHVELWRELLAEMSRISRRFVLVDFPVRGAAHRLAPILFRWKKQLEGNTRPYFDYSSNEVARAFVATGFCQISERRQFFWPMVLHRKMNRPTVSGRLEALARRSGLTKLFGSPCLMLAGRDTRAGERAVGGR